MLGSKVQTTCSFSLPFSLCQRENAVVVQVVTLEAARWLAAVASSLHKQPGGQQSSNPYLAARRLLDK